MTELLTQIPLAQVEVTREIFEGLGLAEKIVFYVLTTIAIGVFLFGAGQRVWKYRKGRSAAERLKMPFRKRVVHAAEIAGNTTVAKRDPVAGLAHFFIFWGFLVLLAGTIILTIDYDIVRLVFGEDSSFFRGTFYKIYSLTLDMFGIAFIGALVVMGVRRWSNRLPQLDYTRAEEPEEGYSRMQFWKGDWLFLGLLGGIAITGFVLEGFRIQANAFPDFEIWSPIGYGVALAFDGVGIGEGTADLFRYAFWWNHSLLALGFVAYIPYSKAMHMIVDVANLAFHDESSSRHLPAAGKDGSPIAYRTISDFTWKELLDLDACTKCGRCHVACPATASGAPLSPRDLILDLRQWADEQSGVFSVLDREDRSEPTGPLTGLLVDGNGNGEVKIAGRAIPTETLWACTTCMACVEACPVGIEHVPTIVNLRRSLVDEGDMEQTLIDTLGNIAQQGNSFGKSSRMRARWTKKLDFKIPDARKEPVAYLWFVGDFAAFDDRLQELSRTFANILHTHGVSFGLLYEGERNSGNDVRRVGEEGLFEMLVEHNLDAFSKATFEEIFTTDPHSFNTLRNEYPDYGFEGTVKHYTQLIYELVRSGEIPVRSLGKRVTYHDPCYLGRYNRVTEAPRKVIEALGCELVEMPRNRSNTFCCGAGGGRIWMDDSGLEERPSENRIKEAVELGVDVFVVSCPKDVTMYTDAVKTTGNEDRIRVVDIIELLEEAVAEPVAVGAGSEHGDGDG